MPCIYKHIQSLVITENLDSDIPQGGAILKPRVLTLGILNPRHIVRPKSRRGVQGFCDTHLEKLPFDGASLD